MLRSLLALTLLLAFSCAAPVSADAGLARLKKAVRKALDEREPRRRASALGKAVRGADGAGAVKLLVRSVLAEDDSEIVKNIAVVTLGRMKSPEALPTLRELAGAGTLDVRVRVVRAIGRSRLPEATTILESLADEQPGAVRTAALVALAQRADETAARTFLAALDDELWETRSAAVEGLLALGARDHVPALCRRMKLETGRLVDDLSDALAGVTGKAFGPDPGRYLALVDESGGTRAPETWKPPPLSFESPLVATRSRRILFVLFRGESMGDAVEGADHAEGVVAVTEAVGEDLAEELQAATTKLQAAQVHLRTMIRSLRDGVRFDVLTYASPDFVFGKLVVSSPRTRRKAESSIARLSASGIGDLYTALERAFDPRAKDPLGAPEGPDTIVLLSDGNLQEPAVTDREEIQRAVEHWKSVRQVAFQVVGVGQSVANVLSPLAESAPSGAYVTVP
jgi:hypothetical protein